MDFNEWASCGFNTWSEFLGTLKQQPSRNANWKKNNYDAYSFKDVHINKYFMKSAQKKMKIVAFLINLAKPD